MMKTTGEDYTRDRDGGVVHKFVSPNPVDKGSGACNSVVHKQQTSMENNYYSFK